MTSYILQIKKFFSGFFSFHGRFRFYFHQKESTFAEAEEECRYWNGSLAVVDSKQTKSAVLSLLISSKNVEQMQWNKSIWTKALTKNGDQNNSSLLVPLLLSVKVEGGHSDNETKNYSLVSTTWKNVSLHEKHLYVCKQGNFLDFSFAFISCYQVFLNFYKSVILEHVNLLQFNL